MEESERNGAKANRLKAAVFLKGHADKIREEWEKRVRSEVIESECMTSPVLVNSLEILMGELVDILGRGEFFKKTIANRGMTEIHGSQRAAVGYFLPQLLKEFSILREVIGDELNEWELLSFDVRRVIDKVIDSAISVSATEFVGAQNSVIKDALRKAESSNRDLEHLAAVAAHDLKSPLATISGYLDLLSFQAKGRLKESDYEYIRRMKGTSGRMSSLIDHLLKYARLKKTSAEFCSVDMEDVVEISTQNLAKEIEVAGAQINRSSMPVIDGDIDLLIQLFQNLVANSIKFCGNHVPKIQILAEEQLDFWCFSICDNGVGFESKEKEEIFDLFKRIPGGKGHERGTGIGLASCRKVVELHGGRIWAESVPGEGATFFFTLPKKSEKALTFRGTG